MASKKSLTIDHRALEKIVLKCGADGRPVYNREKIEEVFLKGIDRLFLKNY